MLFSAPDWDNDVPEMGLNFNRKKIKEKLRNKNEPEYEPGRFVRLPKDFIPDEEPITRKKVKSKNKRNKVDDLKKQPPVTKKDRSEAKILKTTKRTLPTNYSNVTVTGQSSFRDKLVGSLKGSRFRYINELLYTTTGNDAIKLFQDDPTAYNAYHDGYRQQVEQWPLNPLTRIVNAVRKLPKHFVIADFGCGEGRLAKSLSHKVYSLDLVANRSDIIACDMAATPLDSNSVNVVVFCLSLMGTNLKDFILEANRVLKIGGLIKIAEVESRFGNVKEFIDGIKRCGFELVSKDLTKNLFYFMNFKKIRNVSSASIEIKLKPCLYKKR